MQDPRPDEDSTLPDEALLKALDGYAPINAEGRDLAVKKILEALDALNLSELEERMSVINHMVVRFRKEIEVVGSSVTPQNLYPEHDDKWYESFTTFPERTKPYEGILDSLKGQYADLPESCRKFGDKVYSWEEILEANPNVQYDFMIAGNLLDKPAPYFINEKGWMVFGDGGKKPHESTLNRDYIDNKISAMHGIGLNMITFQEFLRRSETQPTWKNIHTWLESGPIRIRVAHGDSRNGETNRGLMSPTRKDKDLGALRVNRIPLKFPE